MHTPAPTRPGTFSINGWHAQEKTSIRDASVNRPWLRVTSVDIAPEAQRLITQSGQHLDSIQSLVANFLEASIAESADVPICP